MAPLSVRFALSRFLDPMVILIVALGVGIFLLQRGAPRPIARWQRVGRGLAWGAWAALYLFSMPIVANYLNGAVEMAGPDLAEALAGADPARTALVVLAGGMRTLDTSIPPRERLDAATTSRILGAARLARDHDFATIVLSGAPDMEGEAMADLITTLGVPRARLVLESASLNTRENAEYAARILRDRGAETVVVATSENHLRRAVREFRRAGVTVIPAPVDVVGVSRFSADQLLPSANAIGKSHMALHEILGGLRP